MFGMDDDSAEVTTKAEGMTDDQLNAIIDAELGNAIGSMSGNGSRHINEIAKAMDYYLGEPFGTETEGRSKVVSTDVQDTIESILPTLLKLFTSGEQVVTFEPEHQKDEEAAKQATDYINHIFMRDNNGFMILYTWFKDALLQRNGYLFPHWEKKDRVIKEEYAGISDDDVALLTQDDSVEIIGLEKYPHPNASMAQQPAPDVNDPLGMLMPGNLNNIRIKRTIKEGRMNLRNIPPEYVILSRGAVSIEDAPISGFRFIATISNLREQGYSDEVLESIPDSNSEVDNTLIELSRWKNEDGYRNFGGVTDDTDLGRRRVWVSVVFVRADFDGDGYSELRMVTRAGYGATGGTILENDEVEVNDLCSITPIIMPHKAIGRSVADLVMEIQQIKSTIQRQWLDSLYLANNPRWKVLRGRNVDIDSLINAVPGGAVMMDGLDGVEPLAIQTNDRAALQMIEYQDTVRETRTGVTRYNQGLDAQSLNKTASGINMIQNASMQRIELIARIFAETGVTKLFKSMLRLTVQNQDKERVVKIRDKWIPFDPRSWNSDMSLSISVGLGAGTQESKAQQYLQLYGIQKDLAPTGLVKPENIYNTVSRYIENTALNDPKLYLQDPENMPPAQDPKEAEMMQMNAAKEAANMKQSFAMQQQESENASKERMKAAELASEEKIKFAEIQSEERVKMAEGLGRNEMLARPTTQVQISGEEQISQVAQSLNQSAITLQQIAAQNAVASQETSAALTNAIHILAATMSAPKRIITDNGRPDGNPIGLEPMLPN